MLNKPERNMKAILKQALKPRKSVYMIKRKVIYNNETRYIGVPLFKVENNYHRSGYDKMSCEQFVGFYAKSSFVYPRNHKFNDAELTKLIYKTLNDIISDLSTVQNMGSFQAGLLFYAEQSLAEVKQKYELYCDNGVYTYLELLK